MSQLMFVLFFFYDIIDILLTSYLLLNTDIMYFPLRVWERAHMCVTPPPSQRESKGAGKCPSFDK